MQLYWRHSYPDFFNEGDKYPKMDIYLLTDNLESGGGTNNAESSNNFTGIVGIEGYGSNDELKIVYNKIARQYLYNKSVLHRNINIYSDRHPTDAQLTYHECGILHNHLLSLNKNYELRHISDDNFRMFVNSTSKDTLKPTLTLLRDIRG